MCSPSRELLFCLHAFERRLHGKFREQSPSSFLDEIPGVPQTQRPASKGGSVNGVLSFFQNAPVQFDPSAIRSAKQARAAAARSSNAASASNTTSSASARS